MRLHKMIFLLVALLTVSAYGQSEKYLRYIQTYREMAIHQMREHQVPASITMAQGLLESAAGTSVLAVKGRNHFGIKAHNDWTGPVMLRDDDAPNEKFRVYSNAEDSYKDHSLFLKNSRRYASLFQLPITDYKSWAHGLKAAGYATNPTYAYKLIQIIEDYNLTELDREALGSKKYAADNTPVVVSPVVVAQSANAPRPISYCNKNYYIIARPGDTYKKIAAEYGISERKLRKNNEVDKRYQLKAGDVVYFEKKQAKAHKSFKKKYHVMQSGESLYSISQKYGMRLKTLYKINRYAPDHMPKVGDKIRLR